MKDLVRASILFKVDNPEPLDALVNGIREGFLIIQADQTSALRSFEVKILSKSHQIAVDVELEVPENSTREIEDDVTEIVAKALNHSGQFTWGSRDDPNRVHLTQGLSQYAYA